MYCFACKKTFDDLIDGRVQFKEICPFCGQDLHCCLNCKSYKVSAPNSCIEPDIEPVYDKEKANFCEYFRLKEEDKSKQGPSLEDVRKKLFGD